MVDQTQDHGSTLYFLTGLLIGGLTGVAVSLLMAPRSGQETRDQIQRKGIELRDEAAGAAEGAIEQVRRKSQGISSDIGEKVGELKQRSQKVVNETRDELYSILASKQAEVKES